jgi:uncharacterized protein (TIGR02246 family)
MSVDSMQVLVDQFATAFNNNDAGAVSRMYLEDARILPPGQETVQGRASIETFIGGFFEAGIRAVEFEPLSRDQREEMGVEVGRYVLRSEGGGPAVDEGKYVSVRRQQPDTTWLIEVDIFNSSRPPPTGG